MKQTIKVKGMHCNSCKILVSEALEEAGAKDVQVELDQKNQLGTVTISSDLPKSEIAKIIREQGEYEVL